MTFEFLTLASTETPEAPMPASAWELVALWCDVWDAPRFRDGRQLSREASLPLLKLAASCVAQLGGRQEGASRDYLAGAPKGGSAAITYG